VILHIPEKPREIWSTIVKLLNLNFQWLPYILLDSKKLQFDQILNQSFEVTVRKNINSSLLIKGQLSSSKKGDSGRYMCSISIQLFALLLQLVSNKN
jgi:hypothetical protein